MKKYKCIKSFEIKFYNEDFVNVDYQTKLQIEKDTIWELKPELCYIDGEYHLETKINNYKRWIEISKERLEKYFIEANDESVE